MKIGLASKRFINGDIQQNSLTIVEMMKEAKQNNVEMLCFGEAFLQGFDSLCWNYDVDKERALNISSLPIQQICKSAKEIGICTTFGWIENDDDLLYCSYMVINDNGEIIYNFKRVSPGWKESFVDKNYYREGNSFSTFQYKHLHFTVGLCGDFWDEENVRQVAILDKDITLWPLYINFSIKDFEANHKKDYAKQAKKLKSKVLFINSLSKDPNSFGGCYEFFDGNISNELKYGVDGVLYVEV
ncbi:MAG: carbon-nitrogen hydrolase family protein [Turicibacter sp.]